MSFLKPSWTHDIPRWEGTGALIHHCGTCGRPLSHPEAMNSCIGKHEFVCCKYHPVFFRKGREDACASFVQPLPILIPKSNVSSCMTSTRLRDGRIKEIAGQIRKLRRLSGTEPSGGAINSPKPVASPGLGLSKRQRKLEKKTQKALGHNIAVTPAELHQVTEALELVGQHAKEDAILVEIDKCLRGSVTKSLFYDEAWRDALMAPPVPEPKYEQEAERVLQQQLITSDPKQRDVKEVYAEIKETILQQLKASYNEDCEVRKRRISYARWVTQSPALMEHRGGHGIFGNFTS